MIWIILALIFAAFIISKAIEQNGERAAAIELEKERIRLTNTPEYRKKYNAIQDFLELKELFQLWNDQIHRAEAELYDEKAPSTDRARTLIKIIKENTAKREKNREEFDKKYSNSPYDPARLPFGEWPAELLERNQALDEVRDLRYEETREAIYRQYLPENKKLKEYVERSINGA